MLITQWRLGMALAVAALLAGNGRAQVPVPTEVLVAPAPAAKATDATAQAPSRSLVFTVLESETKRPIPGVQVQLQALTLLGQGVTPNPSEATTDDSGRVNLRLPGGPIHNLSIAALHTNYALKQMVMYSENGDAVQNIPAEYTLHLDKGITIGGFVQDERGKGIAGAKIILWGYGDNPGRNRSDTRPLEISAVPRNETNAVLTDAKGFWTWGQVPPDLRRMEFEVLRPGGAISRFGTDERERLSHQNATRIEMAELMATNAILTLKDGHTVRGRVVDGAGKPVAGVRLRERSGNQYYSASQALTNQPDGTFELRHRDNHQFALTAEADGFATTSVIVSPATSREVRLEMAPAQPLRVRVVGEKDEPVTFAEVRPVEWRTRNHVLAWKSKTDGQGKVVWENPPLDEVTYYIAATNYPIRAVRLKPSSEEQTVRLRKDADKRIVLVVKAVDGESGQAIPTFEVRKSQQWAEQYVQWGEPARNGVFRGEIQQGDLNKNYVSAFRLQVRAQDYAPSVIETVYFDEGDQEFNVKLVKTSPPSGTVLQPDGQPAEKAQVVLNTGRNSIYLNRPGEIYANQPGMFSQRTGPDGKFKFDAAEPSSRIFVNHAQGYVSLTVEELKRSPEVRLQPWAKIEGVVKSGGNIKANERLALRYPMSWEAAADNVHLSYYATSDREGRFAFTNLPPGAYVLYRQGRIQRGPVTESHRMIIDVKAGETKQLEYATTGRKVVGHVEADAVVDWKNDAHLLVLKVPEPPPPVYAGFADPKEFEKARRAHAQSPAVQEYERKRNQYQIEFKPDGDFEIEDVPPGKYELRLRVTKPPENPNGPRFYGNEHTIGTLTREVTIPPGKDGEEVDLGSFELEVKEPKLVNAAPLSLQATTLDGKPFDLASLHGKPVVLTFWAEWAPKSVAHLEAINKARPDIKGATFLTVNLDEDPAVAQARVKALAGAEWVHVRLVGNPRVLVTEELSIDALPMTFVLDDKGRPAARDVEGKRVRAAVQRVVTKTAKK